MTVQITTNGTTLAVKSPYNSDFVSQAKLLNGKWRDQAWTFDSRDEQRIRELCRRVYGTDGTIADLVSVRAKFTSADHVLCGPIEIFGRTVARATGRDSGARLGEGVLLVSGKFSSGGSMKNWETTVRDEAIVIIRDLPRASVEAAIASGSNQIIQIEPETQVINSDSLLAERAKLQARIAEITQLLGDGNV